MVLHTRVTRTSSDLRTLSAVLLPPSPILKADLLISSTSGEIPILLEDTTHVYNPRFSGFGEWPGLRDVAREPNLIDNLAANVGKTNDLNRGNEASLTRRGGESDDTCIPPKFPNAAHTEPTNDSCPARTISGESKGVIPPAHDNATAGDAERSSISGDRSTPIYGKLESPWDPQASRPNTMELSTTTVIPQEDLGGERLTFHAYATLPMPTFVPPSSSTDSDVISPLSSPVGPRHRRPLERARAVRFPGRPRSPRSQPNEAESSLVRNGPPSLTNHASCPQWQLTGSAPPCAADTCAFDTAHPFVKRAAVPEELPWIKHMAIELWIDQEGFRAVKSCMQLMGYSPRTRSLHPYESAENAGSGPTGGVAEFMPMKREMFAFHYATLDSPPTLRMVSIAGDASRDYISRQVTLNVKTNGVYTVLGTETAAASTLNSDTHGSSLLCWKFDYLIGDRKADGSGKTLSGEKTLTPLTFSCSPYLFHPLQGKKTGLMHVMKKNLVPKLGSQKLEPPTSLSVLPRASRYLSATKDAASLIRSRSDASAKSGHYSLARSPVGAGAGTGTIPEIYHMPRATRRRRASSAGENSFSCPRNEPKHCSGMFTFRRGGLVG